MKSVINNRFAKAIMAPALVFMACAVIFYSGIYKTHADRLAWPLLGDILLVAPLSYFMAIRNTSISRVTVLRVFMVGCLLAIFLFSGTNAEISHGLRKMLYPAAEALLVGYVVWKFAGAGKQARKQGGGAADFLVQCRSILGSVLGNQGIANAMAAEVAVFYYAFRRAPRAVPGMHYFSAYRNNGIVLVLGTFLCLFLVETAAMHFLFMLWSKTAAWVITGLSLYTCLQLFAHIRAMKTRPTVLQGDTLYIRHGLLGGDADIPLHLIVKMEKSTKPVTGNEIQKIALLRGMEKHSLVIHLSEPVKVMRAFGIQKTATTLLLCLDDAGTFERIIEERKASMS